MKIKLTFSKISFTLLFLITLFCILNAIMMNNKFMISDIKIRLIDSLNDNGCIALNNFSIHSNNKRSAIVLNIEKKFISDYSRTMFSNKKYNWGGEGVKEKIKTIDIKLNNKSISQSNINLNIISLSKEYCDDVNRFNSINSFIEFFNNFKFIKEKDLVYEVYFIIDKEGINLNKNKIDLIVEYENSPSKKYQYEF